MPDPVRVVFLCWGNICRSPMAESVARARAEADDVAGVVFSSAATSTEELGAPMDARAAATLARAGYPAAGHRAHQIDEEEYASADLVVAMEDVHVQRLRRLVGGPLDDRVRLLTDFDPDAEPGSGVPDPWYGDEAGFAGTLASIQAALPGLFDAIRDLQRDRA